MRRIDVHPGERFGQLVVLHEAPPLGIYRALLFKCDCGTEKTIRLAHVRRGLIRSCGCHRVRLLKAGTQRTHGLTNTPEHAIWCSMIGRCTNERNKSYKDYGGRGIQVCDRWLQSFENFLADMGTRPSPKHSIDRVDVNGNYEPGNCRWATFLQQMRNKTDNHYVSAYGKVATLSEWEEITGVKQLTIQARLKRGWSAEDAVSLSPGAARNREEVRQ